MCVCKSNFYSNATSNLLFYHLLLRFTTNAFCFCFSPEHSFFSAVIVGFELGISCCFLQCIGRDICLNANPGSRRALLNCPTDFAFCLIASRRSADDFAFGQPTSAFCSVSAGCSGATTCGEYFRTLLMSSSSAVSLSSSRMLTMLLTTIGSVEEKAFTKFSTYTDAKTPGLSESTRKLISPMSSAMLWEALACASEKAWSCTGSCMDASVRSLCTIKRWVRYTRAPCDLGLDWSRMALRNALTSGNALKYAGSSSGRTARSPQKQLLSFVVHK